MTDHTVIRVLRVASVVGVLLLTEARVEAAPIETSSIGTWEFSGIVTSVSPFGLGGKFADYLSVGTPVTFDIFADPNEPFVPDTSCSDPANQGFWRKVSSKLQAGPFTWVGGDVIELHDELGTCMFGLNLFTGGMVATAAPPAFPPPFLPGLDRLFVDLIADKITPAGALGPQLDLVRSAAGRAESLHGNFQFGVTAVPEPATWILVATGAAGILRTRRRTSRRVSSE